MSQACKMSTTNTNENSTNIKLCQINIRIDQCKSTRLRCFQPKKLFLDQLNLTCADIPLLNDLCDTALGKSLHTLSLARNPLGTNTITIHGGVLSQLPVLRTLDLSQCELQHLFSPYQWNLPKLTILILSHNRLTEFPDERVLEGLPELKELHMYANNISRIVLPSNTKLLSKLKTLDLGYNTVSVLPDELDQLKSLKTLKLMNNLLSKVPMRICDMNLKSIDVSDNPVTEPPFEACKRGIPSMRRYWHSIRSEEQMNMKALATPVVCENVHHEVKKGEVGFVDVDSGALDDLDLDSFHLQFKVAQINLRLDQCESVRFFKPKKLMLDKLNLTCADIPLKDLCGTALGNSLHKLSLAGNRLGAIPPPLVVSLPVLRTLDLSQCELHQLPPHFNLPKLTMLNLSNNRFADFPEESVFEGLPELQELNMYGNKVSAIVVPLNPKLLSKLETLDLGYNNVSVLPDELDQLKSLKTLKVMNNLLSKVPMRICDMDLKLIDVSSNPVTEPPYETCERGICSMRRYWHRISE